MKMVEIRSVKFPCTNIKQKMEFVRSDGRYPGGAVSVLFWSRLVHVRNKHSGSDCFVLSLRRP